MLHQCIAFGATALAIAAAGHAQEAVPRPEHPRPDFERAGWLNLNGQWQFEIDNELTGDERGLATGHDLEGTITVPFCPESRLSGVAHTDFMKQVWYRREFRVPREMTGQRLLLHFGAVDWHARVWVNGTLVGEHKGGYTPFACEITNQVRSGDNEVVVCARDDTRSGLQATGKQSHERDSYGCVYTRTTGIWQTVWLEAVGTTYLSDFCLVPDSDTGRVTFQGTVNGPCEGVKLRLKALAGPRTVAHDEVPARGRSTLALLKVDDPHLWQPGKPYLYDLEIVLEKDGHDIDRVRSYFGFRKVHVDGFRMLINDKPVFQRLVLDQGFYPDGIYTAPSDEALRADIELSMAAGFNGARLHEKVFEPRLLYWADKLGYIVWGEYPDWGVDHDSAAAMGQVAMEWREVLHRDRNHPSIVGWCPLNETGGGEGNAFAQALLAVTQSIDPTRPFLDASGYVHLYPATDVYDSHNYDQSPESLASTYAMFRATGQDPWNNNASDPRSAYRGQPYFVSEYGGTRFVEGEGQSEAWGYGSPTTSLDAFIERYRGLTDALLDNPYMFGFCYTQLTDVEQEQNGIYKYDRTPKYDPALVRAINEREAAYERESAVRRVLDWRAVVPSSRQEPQTWRYTTEAPPQSWSETDFDDSAWATGPGGFGTEGTPGSVVRTVWNTGDIWLRRSFELDSLECAMAALEIHHDEDAEVFINGKRILAAGGYTTNYALREATDALRDALKPGQNMLAVHCHQTTGGQYIDVGIRFAVEK